MHPSGEVAVARQHRHRVDRAVCHRRLDDLGQLPRVADAGRAAVADDVEADRGQILRQTGAFEISGRGWRARPGRRLDPRRHLQPHARALRATSPAAINSRGSEVLVQLVIAAIAIGCFGMPCASASGVKPSFASADAVSP